MADTAEQATDTVVPRHADRARTIVARVLDRLADPAGVVADTNAAAVAAGADAGTPVWADLSLSGGYPGVSLAFSGTAPRGPEHPVRAHAYLARAMAALARERFPAGGVFDGPGAVAVATLVAHHATGGYVSALARLDEHQRRVVQATLPRLRIDEPLPTNGEFETVRGLSGIGRYLLARVEDDTGGAACADELQTVLSHLTALADGEITHRGRKVPRWWTLAAPKLGQEAELPDGHLNLGLSHGVAGPLALLALAWRAGVRVPGQRAAIESLVALLAECAVPDGDALWWPPVRTLDEWAAGPDPDAQAPRPSWCYGVPGVSRAIQSAALALDRPDWHELTRRSLTGLLDTPIADWGIDDAALCHGWGGMLHLLGLLGEHLDDARLPLVRDELAALVLDQYHDAYRFGFRTTMTDLPQGTDVPAFLEGAAGIALALDAYAEGRATAGWDLALLVA
ncbi:lanthionine synthetase C family protein [Embleya sp. NPDC005971]|uniref:lanthionine synthetase C family protein n=1 Tax=Embleya sp. NPDC005971 TaxID=3156724 RepID=UPI0033C443FC